MSAGQDDRNRLTELRKLLSALYPGEGDQRRLAAEARLSVGAIPLASSAYNNWHQILHFASHNRSVDNLLALALDEYPDNATLRSLAEGRRPVVIDGSTFNWQGPADGRVLLEQFVSRKPALVHVSHLAIGLSRARAVAKVLREDGGCGTGFLIGGDRLVTNHHVLPDARCASASHAIFNYQKTISGHDDAAETLRLDPERYFETEASDDFTVVGVSGNPVARWGCIELKPTTTARGDLVNIIQHPGGGPKQIGLSFDIVAYVGAGRLQYLTDTLPGSSGAPVFDRAWNLVALHHSGGWLVEPASADKRVYYRNQGVLIERIVQRL